jgi:hypothetical protein
MVIQGPEQCSIVQCVLLRVFERMVEVGRDAKSMLYSPSQSTVRVLLRESQLDYFVGEIEETVNVTRVHIQILYNMDVPACAAPRERVLQASFLQQMHYYKIQFDDTNFFFDV